MLIGWDESHVPDCLSITFGFSYWLGPLCFDQFCKWRQMFTMYFVHDSFLTSAESVTENQQSAWWLCFNQSTCEFCFHSVFLWAARNSQVDYLSKAMIEKKHVFLEPVEQREGGYENGGKFSSRDQRMPFWIHLWKGIFWGEALFFVFVFLLFVFCSSLVLTGLVLAM